MKKMKLGVNTFGIAANLTKDLDGTLAKIKACGIDYLEPCIIFRGKEDMTWEQLGEGLAKYGRTGGWWLYSRAEEYAAKVNAAGLKIRCAHIMQIFGDKKLSPIIPSLLECGKKLNIEAYVFSLMISDIEKAKDYVDDLRYTAEKLTEQGIALLYHNHESEFVDNNGDCVLDYFFRHLPLMKLEMDVGWVKFAGQDVLSAMEKYKDRISILHLKDITADACQANRETCFAALGEGSVPIAEIINKAKELQLIMPELVIDQDASNGDIMEDLRVGADNVKQYL